MNRTSRNRDVLIDPGNKSGFSLLFRFGTFEKYVSINFRLPENVTGIYFAKVFVIQIFELTQLMVIQWVTLRFVKLEANVIIFIRCLTPESR